MVDLAKPIYRIYKWKLWRQIKNKNVPQHIGVILDGNRRFATERGIGTWEGHKIGAEKVREFLKWCWKLGIKVVTLYAFSIENFNREINEISGIFEIAKEKFREILTDKDVKEKKVRIRSIGRKDLLSPDLREIIEEAEKYTENYSNHFLNIAIGYSGRREITDAFKKIAKKIIAKEIKPEDIDEETISKNLYTAGYPDPDLIIRTSGEERLSGFLLWQSAYSELYFIDVYWPELREIDFWRAIRVFQKRDRRYGK
jgi:tritrans,polycis-undecaprenyl-diphosphate synthase [geranylgeranyl-diphosphate specific]